MSLRDFFYRVQRSARLVPAGYVIDYPSLDAPAIERALRRSSAWLTPRTVAGFTPTCAAILVFAVPSAASSSASARCTCRCGAVCERDNTRSVSR